MSETEDAQTITRSSAVPSGVSRRTVVKTTAWSVPVIAVAMATPMAAASVAPTLEFTNGPYSADACGPVGEVILQLTTDGTTPAPAQPVTVTLPSGLSWADGATGSKVFTTDANGNVTIGAGAIVGSASGTHSITATAGGGTPVTAPVSVATRGVATIWNDAGVQGSYSAPAATAVGWNFYLGPDGTLYRGDTPIASNVSSAVGDTRGDSTAVVDSVAFVDGNGVAQVWTIDTSSQVTSATYTGVPTGSRAVGWNYFLAPNGDLYYGNTLVDSGVTSAVADEINGPADSVTYVSNGQAKVYYVDPSNPTNPTRANYPATVPTGVTAVGHNFVLAPNGDLYRSDGTLIASGVTAAVGDQLGDSSTGISDGVSFIQNGVAMSWEVLQSSAPVSTTFASVPAGATPVGWNFFLTSDGALYHGNDLVATNVLSAVAGEFVPGVDGVLYVEDAPC